MGQVQAIFCRASRLDSWFLRTAMWSSWSHVALIVPSGGVQFAPGMSPAGFSVLDATFFHDVAERPLTDVLAAASTWSLKTVDCPRPHDAYAFARRQVGQPYDTLGVLGIGFHRDWGKADAWFCSEFFEACLEGGGRQRFVAQAGRVTTQHSWMVA